MWAGKWQCELLTVFFYQRIANNFEMQILLAGGYLVHNWDGDWGNSLTT
jgi:hypothetical protein